MQEHTAKDQESTRSRSSPIHIVPTPRSQAGANADALRDVHMSLVRAEQNLYNLVQASNANGQAGFGYAAPPFAAGYAAPAFPPGFAPTAAIGTPPGLAYGTPPGIAYGTPSGISYGTPPGIPYGTPPALAFGAPAGLAYGTPPGIGYGLPVQPNPWATAQPMPAWNPLVPTVAALPGASLAGLASPWAMGRAPACDISDEGKAFVCVVDLPGVQADEVELLCFPHAIAIQATREADAETVSLVQAERAASTLRRTIALPSEIQPGDVKANLSKGILTVTLPKVHPTEGPRRIKVQG